MDGTLVDTEPYWMKAETDIVAEYGGVWTHDDCLTLVGAGLWNSARALQERGVDLDADVIVARLTAQVESQVVSDGAPWRPGAVELLRALREHGVKTALVTMSVRSLAEQVAAQLPFDGFDLLVTGDAVQHPKPHPDAYLTAARLLGVEPSATVAIEDSLPGVASAVASGANVIAVPHVLAIPQSEDHVLWNTLEGRGLHDIAAVYGSRRAEGTSR